MNRPQPILSTQAFVGIQYGYIIIPPDVDRARFIEQCYRWERVSIQIERGGGVHHDCYITRNALQQVEFPATSKQLGSCVVFLTDIHSGLPIILGVISKEDESQLLKESEFKISKVFQGNVVTISGNAEQGVLTLSVSGGKKSQLNITIANTTKDAQLNLSCRGTIRLDADEKLQINTGSQAMVRGTELKTQLEVTNQYLEDLKQAIYSTFQLIDSVVPGVSAAFQADMMGKSPGDYSEIESKESFLD